MFQTYFYKLPRWARMTVFVIAVPVELVINTALGAVERGYDYVSTTVDAAKVVWKGR